MVIITLPLVVPLMTWYLALFWNCASACGVCTVVMTLIPPVSSALFIAVGSWKYLKTTVLTFGLVPQ